MSLHVKKTLKNTFDKLHFIDSNNDLKNQTKEIIQDKTCPCCNIPVVNHQDFCLCGYSLEKEKTLKLWGIVAFTWLFIILFLFLLFSSFYRLNSIVFNKLGDSNLNFYSLSPPGVQIITSLKNSKYRNYIQSIYVNPKEKNILMVLIKPIYWDMLSLKEKNEIKHIITKKWEIIYKNTASASSLKPEVRLANFL